jgi:hypothetical protein
MTLNEFIKKHNIMDISAGPYIKLKIAYAAMKESNAPLSHVRRVKMDAIKSILHKIYEAARNALEDFENIKD